MIAVTQTCDGCGKTRPLPLDSLDAYGIEGMEIVSDWARVADNKHLCPRCVKSALDTLTKKPRLTLVNNPKDNHDH